MELADKDNKARETFGPEVPFETLTDQVVTETGIVEVGGAPYSAPQVIAVICTLMLSNYVHGDAYGNCRHIKSKKQM